MPTLAASVAVLLLLASACSPVRPGGQAGRPPSSVASAGAPAGLAAGRLLFSKGGIDLWSSLPDGTDRTAMTADGDTGGYVGGRWSPNGSMIAAERSLPGEGGTALYLLRPGGSPIRLTRVDTFLDGYSWSPDSRYVAYGEVTSGATASGGLSAVGAIGDVHIYDTTLEHDMVVGPGTHPAFSPDGTRLGYAHASGAIASVDLAVLAEGRPERFPTQMLVSLADLTRVSLTIAPRGMGLIGGPQYSSDGKLIAYAAIERGPVLEAEQILYVQESLPGAPPKPFVIGKTGALHHVADVRWSPAGAMLAYSIINAQPHHHWLYSIDARTGQRRELFDSQQHFLEFTWSPDGRVILLQVDDADKWLYFRPDRPGPIGSVSPGGWRPEWCPCAPRS